MWIFKKLFEWLAKFFGSKAGKNTLKVMVRMFIRDLITMPGRTIIFSFKRTFFNNPLLRYNVFAKEDFAL